MRLIYKEKTKKPLCWTPKKEEDRDTTSTNPSLKEKSQEFKYMYNLYKLK